MVMINVSEFKEKNILEENFYSRILQTRQENGWKLRPDDVRQGQTIQNIKYKNSYEQQ